MEQQFNTPFAEEFNKVQVEVNQTAHEKGWYNSAIKEVLDVARQLALLDNADEHIDRINKCANELQVKEDTARIGLMHSELSEALEGLRHGNPLSDKIGNLGFSQVEEEFADCIIRIMDVSAERGWRIGEAIEAKRLYNKGREYRHGNKAI